MIYSLKFSTSKDRLDSSYNKLLAFNNVDQSTLLVFPRSKTHLKFADTNNSKYNHSFKRSYLKLQDFPKSIKFIKIISYLAQHIINHIIFFIKSFSSNILVPDPD
jgi:hypothetical protein